MAANGTARVDHDSKELVDMGSLGTQQCVRTHDEVCACGMDITMQCARVCACVCV